MTLGGGECFFQIFEQARGIFHTTTLLVMGVGHRQEPLSLEELLQKRKEEEKAKARPKFMSKEERQKLAMEEVRGTRMVSSQIRTTARQNVGESASRVGAKDMERRKQNYPGGSGHARDSAALAKKPRRTKGGFLFQWEDSEDTSGDYYDRGARLNTDAALLFGRGMRAGMDRQEQKKTAAHAVKQSIRDGDARDQYLLKQKDVLMRRVDARDGRDMVVSKHWSEKERSDMTERDWRIFREDFNISFKGVASMADSLLPIRNWKEVRSRLEDDVFKAIQDAGYKKPSPIQMAAIPIGLEQRDVVGIAETGSGKTAAFVIPMLHYIRKQPVMQGNPDIEAEGPYAIVLAPTRELAQQIEAETKKLAKYTGYRVVGVVGGKSIEDQGFALRKGCEIVVATPGRLLDCIKRQYAVLNQCNYVVLDEADRMIDMGFEPEVMGILDAMPSSNLKPENEDDVLEADRVYRTTYMFSATMPPAVERLSKKYLRRPVMIHVGSAGRATDNVSQRVIMVKENEKPYLLKQELELAGYVKTIVFANTHKKCETVTRQLEELGYSVAMLHGGKSQDQREENIHGFRTNKYDVLVATDVAGRGIDVPDVMLVINYDMPHTVEAYTHRIGRTGRAGKLGDSVTFLTYGDSELFYEFNKFLERCKAPIPRELARHEAARRQPTAGRQYEILK
jgi:ATP-dependent RNA helicase DDX23/PRP28